jgi:predicted glycosyltransferase involved in capsule biosynthesis
VSSWVEQPLITEVIIVDWSSTVPVYTDATLRSITSHPKVKVIRVDGETSFIAQAFSQNVGLRFARQPCICKIDIDHVLVDPKFVETLAHSHGTNTFHCGTAYGKLEYWGFVFFEKRHGLRIGGYNEAARGWGYDDTDFYSRLRKSGVRKVVVENIDEVLYHIPHDMELRIVNYEEKDRKVSNTTNKHLSLTGQLAPMSKYTIKTATAKYVSLLRVRR